jgi:hypothetical protein
MSATFTSSMNVLSAPISALTAQFGVAASYSKRLLDDGLLRAPRHWVDSQHGPDGVGVTAGLVRGLPDGVVRPRQHRYRKPLGHLPSR